MIGNDCRCPGCGSCGAAQEVERLRDEVVRLRFATKALYDKPYVDSLRSLVETKNGERIVAEHRAMVAERERDEALSDAERWRNAHHEACVRLQAHDCGEEYAILGADAERWRNAHDVMRETVKKLLLSRDASWIGGNDWSEAVDDAIHALGMEPDDDA